MLALGRIKSGCCEMEGCFADSAVLFFASLAWRGCLLGLMGWDEMGWNGVFVGGGAVFWFHVLGEGREGDQVKRIFIAFQYVSFVLDEACSRGEWQD